MEKYWYIIIIIASILAAIALLTLTVSFICFRITFYSKKRKPLPPGVYETPKGEIYDKHRETMIGWMKELETLPFKEYSITSHDGLTLRGKLYEYKEGAPIEIMLHGYRGNALRDMCGGVFRSFALGRSALIVNHRGSGDSDGSVISFGINERRDLLGWIDLVNRELGERKIILTGISMGAATVLMASSMELPDNVVGILADCGYSSPREIIRKVIRDMHLPPALFYPFIRLGARLYGGFDLEETSAIEAVRNAKVPIIFFHGEADDFVPCDMSRRVYEACTSRKALITVPGAGHGLAYSTDKERYLRALADFFPEYTELKQ